MNDSPIPHWIDSWLTLVAWLVPPSLRAEWRHQWRADLIHFHSLRQRHGRARPVDDARYATGALVDALWIHLDRLREGLLLDLRLAWRSLVRRPATSGVMVAVLALGIGGSAMIGGVVDSVLLAPLPYPDPDRLVRLWETQIEASLDRVPPSKGNLRDLRRAEALDGLAGYYVTPRTVRAHDTAEVVEVAQVSEDFFQVLGRAPHLGRTFTADETARSVFNPANSPQGEDPVIVLAHDFWRSRLQSDRTIIGRTLELESRRWTVIGVMPPDLRFPTSDIAAWIPWSFEGELPRDQRYLQTIGRLAEEVTADQALSALGAIASGLGDRFPDTNRGWGVAIEPLYDSTVAPVRDRLWVALAAVGCIWLLATVNVAVLRLVQARERQGELTIRRALGASRLRLSRRIVIDSALPVLVGGGLGLVTAWSGLTWLRGVTLLDLPRRSELAMRPQVLVVILALAALTSILVSLGPLAVGSSRLEDKGRLRDGRTQTTGRGNRRWRAALVTVEVALAMVLLTSAGLLTHSLYQLYRVDPGFDAEQVLVAPVILDNNRYDGPTTRAYHQALREGLSAVPGVSSVGATTVMPMSSIGPDFARPVWAEGARPPAGEERRADMRMATPGLFDTLGIALRRGRDFGPQDRADSAPVTIVNRTLAERTWPGLDPIGQRLHVDMGRGTPSVYEVVGWIDDVRRHGLQQPPSPEYYVPHAQRPYLIMNVAVRVEGSVPAMIPVIERIILELDPSQPAHSVTALADLVDHSVHTERVTTFLVLLFGSIALLLATVGVYGSLAMTVEQRRREFGIRMALGAASHQIRRRVLGSAGAMVGAGLVLGAGLALVAGRGLGTLLYGVEPVDPLAFGGAAACLALAGGLAAWRPVRRALATDPAHCLHAE